MQRAHVATCDLQRGDWTLVGDVPSCGVPMTYKRCGKMQKLMRFQPHTCSAWPSSGVSHEALARSFKDALGSRRLRLIGDSMTEQHFNFIAGCLLKCNTAEQHAADLSNPKDNKEWKSALERAGHSGKVASTALFFIRQNHGKQPYRSGCHIAETGGRVEFRRINLLGGPKDSRIRLSEELNATLRTLVYLPPAWGTPKAQDIVLMNFGIHRDLLLPRHLRGVLDWWRRERLHRGAAPRLLWRQTSPQHWAGPLGLFRSFAHGDGHTAQCTQHPAALHAQGLSEYDLNVTAIIREHGDRAWSGVLPTFRAIWERSDDHAELSQAADSRRGAVLGKLIAEARANGTTLLDCTHFCATGSVITFWTQALIASLASPTFDSLV